MYASHLLAFGRIVASTLRGAAKSLLVNLSFLGEDESDAQGVHDQPMFSGTPGFYARPKPPVTAAAATPASPAGHCEVVGLRFADEVIPVAYRDLRLSARANPKEGELGVVQYQGGFILLKDNADGTGTDITIYAVRRFPDGTADKAHVLSFDTTTGNSSITLTHETGATITLTKEGKAVVVSPNGEAYVEVKNSGVVVNGANVAITGGAMLGGADPATGEDVMLSTQLLAWIGQVNAFLAVLAPLFNAPPGPVVSGGPGTVVPPTAAPAAATMVKAK